MPDYPGELRDISERLSATSTRVDDPGFAEPVAALEDAATDAARAWSGSSLGYHATVYYADLKPPPPGVHFSSEWGFHGRFQGTTGDWLEYAYDDVLAALKRQAGVDDLAALEQHSAEAREAVEAARGEIASILHAFLTRQPDEFLQSMQNEVEELLVLTKAQGIQAQMPQGRAFMSRDSLAVTQGLKPAPHQEILAEVVALRAPFTAAKELAVLAGRAASHIERLLAAPQASREQGSSVFIGHGRSLLWRELKDFVQDRLGLPWDEFNRVPVAGITNIARLAEMLDGAGIAFLVLTAEDERADGAVVARQNVVHEAGLFQGRLGFTRAIVLLEEGCAEFSNIQGLGQIRFPAGRISAAFEEVRLVLEREGFLEV